jgi:opacity protein-like surface antigen
MRNYKLRAALRTLPWIMALCFTGCQTAPQRQSDPGKAAAASDKPAEEAQRVAESSLGKQSEILAQGDLALNGREQLLVVNRIAGAAPANREMTSSSPVYIMRAAVLEKNNGKWSQILLCDEHLKNPNGYLGGSPKTRITGWHLEYRKDQRLGLEMSFTPATKFGVEKTSADEGSEEKQPTYNVRWNKNTKRYQSFDKSHERYLGEVPSLEAPESILK